MKRVLSAAVLGLFIAGAAAAQDRATVKVSGLRQKVSGLKATVFRGSARGNYVVVYDQSFNRNVVSLDQARVMRVGKNAPIKSVDELRGGDAVTITGHVAPL